MVPTPKLPFVLSQYIPFEPVVGATVVGLFHQVAALVTPPLRVAVPEGPVAPVAPVAPAPVGPVAPTEPVNPVGPVAPVAPTPVGPVTPIGPTEPVEPVNPVGPVAPCGPAGVTLAPKVTVAAGAALPEYPRLVSVTLVALFIENTE